MPTSGPSAAGTPSRRPVARINLVKVFSVARRIGAAFAAGLVLLQTAFRIASDRFDSTPADILWTVVRVFLLATVLSFVGILALLFLGGLLEREEDARQRARERREALRWKIWLFRRTVSDGMVRLEVFELVTTQLSVPPLEPSGGFRERRLQRRYADLHAKVAQIMERSRSDSLDRAVRLLAGSVVERDETLSVWYLSHEPQNYAVRRLLYEYLTVRSVDHPRVGYRFARGVVVTPRWVWVLAARGERAWATGGELPVAVSEECVPLADADPDTICVLYEPGSSGPMGSLAEAVFAARTL